MGAMVTKRAWVSEKMDGKIMRGKDCMRSSDTLHQMDLKNGTQAAEGHRFKGAVWRGTRKATFHRMMLVSCLLLSSSSIMGFVNFLENQLLLQKECREAF
jgi:hypothetical protein